MMLTLEERIKLETAIEKATIAFWSSIVKSFPTATKGDLSPLTTIRMESAIKIAVTEWAYYNVPKEGNDS